MKTVDRSKFAACVSAMLFPVLLLLLAIYYYFSMTAYVSPLMTPDEFGYISVAAFLNGHNWVAVARGIPWYSYGYSLLLAPLFAMTAATHWYRDAQWLNIVLIVSLGISANLLLRKIDRTTRPWVRHVVVAVILLYPSLVFYARLAWAETLIAVMPWLLGLLIYRTYEKPRRYIDAFLCGFLLMGSYYVHARLIVFVVAGLLVFLFMAVKARRQRELCLAVIGMVAALVPAYWFKDFLLAHLYGGAVSGTQQSPLAMLMSTWHRMGHIQAWRDLIGSGAGQFVYLIIATLGLLIAGGAATWQRLYSTYPEGRWGDVAALAFVLLGAVGCFLLVLITMGMSPGLPHHVFYGRYTEPLVLPIVAMGLLHLYNQPNRAALWMAIAFALACILVPVGVHLAAHLPSHTTYWTLITGLFTYRTADWWMATSVFLSGFLVVAILVSFTFRVHRCVGLTLVAVLFLCADYGLVQTYASATSSHVRKWQVWALPAGDGLHAHTVKLDMLDGDPYKLRARIQVINAAYTVIPANQWPTTLSGRYEQMVWDGKQVKRSMCSADPPKSDVCTPLEAPARAAVRLSIEAGKSLGTNHAVLPHRLHQLLASMPYLRAVWSEVALSHVTLRYDVTAPRSQGLSIKVFVTKPGQTKWLDDKQVFRFIKPGRNEGKMSIPVPVRTYSGAALPKGFYTLHAVVVGVGGNDYSTATSVPMHIR